ncbi:DUF6456 domain-containing protein [Puniceibacterium sediminis]|uniref:DUF6456 domain-containing protein n=1 Tax=Puniceibacterium sediminis TaxID=1608407 RepID=A0A238YJT6_9RHOB|nr:DUF6456 domain-containing protein [Puniceibacterium sediminis]SNR70893.1 hypothetical protein SAMN06265370_11757 [Puniceibacterium sediminis]
MIRTPRDLIEDALPGWVPEAARNYLVHIETGLPIRALARQAGCHASTVLRQVRKLENRRDDPLVDAALRRLGQQLSQTDVGQHQKETAKMNASVSSNPANVDQKTLAREARRILRRLSETGAMLAVAAEMEKAVVVRDTADGGTTRTAVVDSTIAQAMALKDWIACVTPGRIARYRITAAGRAALSMLMAEQESRLRGFAEAQSSFAAGQLSGRAAEDEMERQELDPRGARTRYSVGDSPLAALARRRERDGSPFLGDDLVSAGERLREDFELSQMNARVGQNWDQFLTTGGETSRCGTEVPRGAEAARTRVAAALRELGPGLADVAMRCCCHLEGLETAEKRMGWSARSGKIVLRIALQRLHRHYDATIGAGGGLIG